MIASEIPVIMTRADGGSIHGILHTPARAGARGIGIHILNPGLKTRVAPNRLNVLMARTLAGSGYHVLRTDPPGIGDSGGDLPQISRAILWHEIEHGKWAETVREVNARFKAECDLDEIIMVGNCGGAITSLLAAEKDPVPERLVLIDLPVRERSPESEAGPEIIGTRQGLHIFSAYLRNVGDPKAWRRLLKFQTDYRTIWRALVSLLKRGSDSTQRSEHVAELGSVEGLSAVKGINLDFARALQKFHKSNGRALFIHAGDDESTQVFQDLVADRFFKDGGELASRHPRVIIPEANHIYGTVESREALLRTVKEWVEQDVRDELTGFRSTG